MGRMIHTKVVIDMRTGATLESEGFWHEGPVAECKGGGGSVNSVDYEYNARMASIAEEQQQWARAYYDMWQKEFKPYEIAQARTNMQNLPLENSVYRGQLEAARDLLPLESDLYRQQLKAEAELLPQQTEATKNFLSASAKGVDVAERMGMAKADVASAWKGMNDATARANARMGVNPNSGRYQGTQAALATQQAAQTAQAVTGARVGAEQENYDRLMKAASVSQNRLSGSPTNTIFQGLSFLGG